MNGVQGISVGVQKRSSEQVVNSGAETHLAKKNVPRARPGEIRVIRLLYQCQCGIEPTPTYLIPPNNAPNRVRLFE